MATLWTQLKSPKKPILSLAPMDDVTDVVFRQVVAEVAPPDVFFTEFTNCDALWSPGREVHGRRLLFTEDQRRIVAQIWGAKPENYYKTAQLLVEKGFDGIDINMGCPDKAVRASGACSALIENRTLAAEIIAATKEGAGELPVSVKTRLGVKQTITEDWIGWLLEQDLAALAIHGRTVAQMSKVPADWEEIGRAVELRDEMQKETVMFGNGDVVSYEQAVEYAQRYGVDGVMIGRGIFQDLWMFDPKRTAMDVPLDERLAWLDRHLELWQQQWGEDGRNPDIMRKFLKVYVAGLPGANQMRQFVMEERSISGMREKVAELREELL